MPVPLRVWLDDIRKAPPGWLWVRTAHEAIACCLEGGVEDLSLDYDLDESVSGYGGPPPGVGGDVSLFLVERARAGDWRSVPDVIRIHSANGDGVADMAWHLSEIERLRWARDLGLPPEAAI